MKKLCLALLTLANTFGIAVAASNPASTAYVNQRFNEAVQLGTYTAGSGILINGHVISETQLEIGQLYQGGIIFYLDSTNRHGLAISLSNSASAVISTQASAVYATMTGIGAGALNTAALIAAQTDANQATAGPSAALLAVTANGLTSCRITTDTIPTPSETCYGGWHIPSVGEFQQIFLAGNTTINDAVTNNGGASFLDTIYWSSTTSSDGTKAYDVTLKSDGSIEGSKEIFAVAKAVRTIRAF